MFESPLLITNEGVHGEGEGGVIPNPSQSTAWANCLVVIDGDEAADCSPDAHGTHFRFWERGTRNAERETRNAERGTQNREGVPVKVTLVGL